VMLFLARAKRRLARVLGSQASRRTHFKRRPAGGSLLRHWRA
jgi:hypothetical protein